MKENKNRITKYLPLGILLIAAFLILLYGFVKVRLDHPAPLFGKGDGSFSPQLSDGDIMEADFLNEGENVRVQEFCVSFVDYGVKDQKGELLFSVTDDKGAALLSETLPVSEIREWEWIPFALSEAYELEKGTALTIAIQANGFTQENALSVVLAKEGVPDIRVRWSRWESFQKAFLVSAILLMALLCFAYTALYRKETPFFITGTASCVLLLALYFVMTASYTQAGSVRRIVFCAAAAAVLFLGLRFLPKGKEILFVLFHFPSLLWLIASGFQAGSFSDQNYLEADNWFLTAGGSYLGGDVMLPQYISWIFLILLILSFFGLAREKGRLRIGEGFLKNICMTAVFMQVVVLTAFYVRA